MQGGIKMEDMVYTLAEVAEILRTNTTMVGKLVKKGLLRALKLGRLKVRKVTLEEFLEKYEGKNLDDLDNIVDLEVEGVDSEDESPEDRGFEYVEETNSYESYQMCQRSPQNNSRYV
jgi:excisionase family DNA binding protein